MFAEWKVAIVMIIVYHSPPLYNKDNTYLAKQLVDCNVERAELSEEVSRLRGCIARWQTMQEEASLRTPTACSPPQATTAAVTVENGDSKLSDSSSSTSLSSSFSPCYEIESLSAPSLPALPPPLPQQQRRQQGVKVPSISNVDQVVNVWFRRLLSSFIPFPTCSCDGGMMLMHVFQQLQSVWFASYCLSLPAFSTPFLLPYSFNYLFLHANKSVFPSLHGLFLSTRNSVDLSPKCRNVLAM